MSSCPNCGRQTLRTKDWACQWCGYPLLGRGYKTIDKTFQQLQEERQLTSGESGTEREIVPEAEIEPEPEPLPSPRAEPSAESRPVPRPTPEPAPPPEPEPEAEPEAELAAEPEPELKPEPEPAIDAGPILSRLEAASGAIQVSVDELNAAYQADKLAAHSRLANKVLTVTGLVDKIFVKEHLDIRYIVLTAERKAAVWNVRCTFDRENAAPLNHLTEGRTAAVMGKYDGYGNNIIMKNCALIS
jgi:ribosomal protein L37E